MAVDALTARSRTPLVKPGGEAWFRVIQPGPLATVQDFGRPGYAHLGVGTSGAADPPSLVLANRLVGNPPDSPAVEVTLGGLHAELTESRVVAITGAPVPVLVNDRPLSQSRRFLLRFGDRLRLGRPPLGLRTYVAVSGGFQVKQVLGSTSYDSLAELGPAPLAAGDRLRLGRRAEPPWGPDELMVSRVPAGTVVANFRWGPRHDMFDADDRARFVRTRWRISQLSNRVGARLIGGNLHRVAGGMPSEGMVTGAIQVPPSGEPIVFLADHPVTGGYPVIGVVTERDVALISQAPPDTHVDFQPIPAK